jgi:hypothetical protein
MRCIKETSSTSQTLATESAVRLSGLETRSLSQEQSAADLALHVNQLSVQLHTLHSVTVARLGGLEEILQRLVHKAQVSEGDVTAHSALSPGTSQLHEIERQINASGGPGGGA